MFESLATNLVEDDTNGASDIFVRDRQSGTTTRVSTASNGSEGDGQSRFPAMSASGRYVAFVSSASNLVDGDVNGFEDVFLHDTETGETRRVSVGVGASESNGPSSFWVDLSADGRKVAFSSSASNLVLSDVNSTADIFVFDTASETTSLESVSSTGDQGNGISALPDLTADGSALAFTSYASNLVPSDSNGSGDIFVRDLANQTTEIASVSSNGVQGPNGSTYASISDNGRFVAFRSSDALVTTDDNFRNDVYLRDLQDETTNRISESLQGEDPDEGSGLPALSRSAQVAVFESDASNLVDGDSNGEPDIFVRLRG